LQLLRAVGYFTHKYGRITYVESFNEYWLETEARLRKDFNIHDGYRPKLMAVLKRKSGMKGLFKAAGIILFLLDISPILHILLYPLSDE
jgi:hypothetical protein